MVHSTKGQIRMMETTMVLFVFFFILMIGMGVYANVQTNKLEQLDRRFNQQASIESARTILSLQEIACSNSGVREQNCFDVEKLPGFRRMVRDNPLYYQNLFGSSKAILVLPSATYPAGSFYTPDFFDVYDGDDPNVAFGTMPWEVTDFDGDGLTDEMVCTCGPDTVYRDFCTSGNPTDCPNLDSDDDDVAPDDLNDLSAIFIEEEAQLLFDFSGDLQNKQTFYFPVSLWDARYVPERSYFGWIIIEVYS